MASSVIDSQPQALDQEKAVLGAVLKDDQAMSEVVDILADIDFLSPQHRLIYRAALNLFGEGKATDIVLMTDELIRLDGLDRVGGRLALVDLSEGVASIAHLRDWAKIVKGKSQLRQLIASCKQTINNCQNERELTEDVLNAAEQSMFAITNTTCGIQVNSIGDLLSDAIQQVMDYQSGTAQKDRLATGFKDIDYYLQGMARGNLIILAGYPSFGKSQLGLQIGANIVTEAGKPVLFISLEMTSQELAFRLLCTEANVEKHAVRDGQLVDMEVDRLTRAQIRLQEQSLHIVSASMLTISELRGLMRRQIAENNTALVIVDYLTLMDAGRGHENTTAAVSYISRMLKALAMEFNIPLMCLSQLSRPPKGAVIQRPRLSDLRSSGQIEQDANVVMFVHQEEGSQGQQVSEVIIAKNRGGRCGVRQMSFAKGHWGVLSRMPESR